MRIQCDPYGGSLEIFRPDDAVEWHHVGSGSWREGAYHSGHVEYRLCVSSPGVWLLESIERNEVLDGVTEEDVFEGRLNDDQLQAMWGMTLEEAQEQEHRQIIAVAEEVPDSLNPDEVGRAMLDALDKAPAIRALSANKSDSGSLDV